VADTTILEKLGKKTLHVLPFKPPMVVKPKLYSKDSLGGTY
jgi:hypothetical protein